MTKKFIAQLLIAECGLSGYGAYNVLYDLLTNESDVLPLNYKTLRKLTSIPTKLLQKVVEGYDLFDIRDGYFTLRGSDGHNNNGGVRSEEKEGADDGADAECERRKAVFVARWHEECEQLKAKEVQKKAKAEELLPIQVQVPLVSGETVQAEESTQKDNEINALKTSLIQTKKELDKALSVIENLKKEVAELRENANLPQEEETQEEAQPEVNLEYEELLRKHKEKERAEMEIMDRKLTNGEVLTQEEWIKRLQKEKEEMRKKQQEEYEEIRRNVYGTKPKETAKPKESVEPPIQKEEEKKEEQPKRKVFVKPTVEEVEAYRKEKDFVEMTAEEFWDFYESKGWKVGRDPMKDWKAAVRNWYRNRDNFNIKTKSNGIRNTQLFNDGRKRVYSLDDFK